MRGHAERERDWTTAGTTIHFDLLGMGECIYKYERVYTRIGIAKSLGINSNRPSYVKFS